MHFGGKINEIYKENAETLTTDLISKMVTSSQSKIQGSSFSSQVRRNDEKPQSEVQKSRPREDFESTQSRTLPSPSRDGLETGKGSNRY